MTNFFTYLTNTLNYWFAERERAPYFEPADVVRSIEKTPGIVGSIASWAAVVAEAVAPVAAVDLAEAVALAGWNTDPGQRLVALSALAKALADAGDPRAADALAAVGRAAVRLPRYVAELDMTKVDQAPMLTYLDPSARARWEAALRLPPGPPTLRRTSRRPPGPGTCPPPCAPRRSWSSSTALWRRKPTERRS